MIDRARFEQLATLAIADEASPQERDELAAMTAERPALAAELAAQRATDRTVRRAATSESIVPLPASVATQLERTRREALATRTGTEATVAGGTNVTILPPAARIGLSIFTRLALAASLALLAGLSAFYLFRPPPLSSKDIVILAPRGETGFTQPTIAWDALPEQRYDVWVLPAEGRAIDAPALYVARGVRPPVSLAALQPGPGLQDQTNPSQTLQPGTDYRMLVCLADAGRVAGVAVPFRTSAQAEASAPAPSLATARNLANAGRHSDALATLIQLTPEQRKLPEIQTLERELRTLALKPRPPVRSQSGK